MAYCCWLLHEPPASGGIVRQRLEDVALVCWAGGFASIPVIAPRRRRCPGSTSSYRARLLYRTAIFRALRVKKPTRTFQGRGDRIERGSPGDPVPHLRLAGQGWMWHSLWHAGCGRHHLHPPHTSTLKNNTNPEEPGIALITYLLSPRRGSWGATSPAAEGETDARSLPSNIHSPSRSPPTPYSNRPTSHSRRRC